MEPFYRKIYGQAWLLIKKNLHLVFFGLFASLLGFNEIKIIFDFQTPGPNLLSSGIGGWWGTVVSLLSVNISWDNLNPLMSLIGLFIIFAAVVILAVSSQGALMHSAANPPKTGTGKIKMNNSLQVGLEKFWPLLGLNILNLLVGYYFLIFVIQPLISIIALSQGLAYYLLLAIIIFFLLIPLVIMISFATRYGIGYVVVYDQPVFTAFNNGWNLFRINWLITVESAIAILGTTILFFILMTAIIAMVFTPFIVISYILASSNTAAWLIMGIGGLLAILILIILTAFFGAFYNLLWSNIFLRLTSRTKHHSKVHRLAHRHLPLLTK